MLRSEQQWKAMGDFITSQSAELGREEFEARAKTEGTAENYVMRQAIAFWAQAKFSEILDRQIEGVAH